VVERAVAVSIRRRVAARPRELAGTGFTLKNAQVEKHNTTLLRAILQRHASR